MFDLSKPGTEKSVQNVYEGMCRIEDRVNDSPLVQPRGEYPLWTVYPLHVKFIS